MQQDPRDGITEAIPSLRAFAISLAGDRDVADDLVQETLVRALGALDSFQPGTNMRAWLFTILRNGFYTLHRKRRREVEDPDDVLQASLATPPPQYGRLEWLDFTKAFAQLNANQREALILFVADGLSLEEVADVMGVALGTAKSRIIRARARLAELLDGDAIGPAPAMLAALRTAA